jgi:hypothetical protein
MHLRLFGITYHDSEVERFIQMRTMEWEAFPVFATRAFAPVAMFWIPWWHLILVLLLASVIWCPIRNHIASPELATFGTYIGSLMVSLPANIIIAVIFFSQAKLLEGCLALL